MNRLERTAAFAGLGVLSITLQFVASLLGWPVSLFVAAILGAAISYIWMRFHPPARLWLVPLLVSACCLLSALLTIVAAHVDPLCALGVVPSLAASAGTVMLARWDRARCDLCSRRLLTQTLVFRCPRCQLQVCDESCWSFEHRRCNLCLEQRVPILPLQEQWWSRATGPRFHQGRCQVCLAAAAGADLRACPHCRRLQCRECWDFHNGSCVRCARPLPHLPEALSAPVAEVTG